MNEISKNQKQVVVKPGKNVVASMANEFRSQLHWLVQESPHELVIDLDGVEMVDSVGISIIIATHNSLDEVGGCLRLTNVASDIYTLFTIMRLDNHFTIEKNE
jgi:anti-sigma B factor antagonist